MVCLGKKNPVAKVGMIYEDPFSTLKEGEIHGLWTFTGYPLQHLLCLNKETWKPQNGRYKKNLISILVNVNWN